MDRCEIRNDKKRRTKDREIYKIAKRNGVVKGVKNKENGDMYMRTSKVGGDM